ncbi:hypothetical protein [Lichenicoccus sp.]|uniref:hypothetical protein n=1 Tax=Lichenicoccus sp. TaxID=2781899 RepID=UPI003D09E75D
MIESIPRTIMGIFNFSGAGFDTPITLEGLAPYRVPGDKRAQLIYLRAGNASGELIVLVLMRNGTPMRLFPVGAKSDAHVSLAVVEDLFADTELAVRIAAPAGLSSVVVLDMGLMEI